MIFFCKDLILVLSSRKSTELKDCCIGYIAVIYPFNLEHFRDGQNYSNDLERVQKSAVRKIFNEKDPTYDKALSKFYLDKLDKSRESCVLVLLKNKPKMAYSRDLPKMAVMDYHGLSLTIMDCHELSWTIMDYH